MSDASYRSISIPRRFVGPPDTAQGGYVGGILAGCLGADAAEVRLRQPTPLETALDLVDADRNSIALRRGDQVIAECSTTDVSIDDPILVGYEVAFSSRALPDVIRASIETLPEDNRCFGCTPRSDGLQLHPGVVPAGDAIACAVDVPDDLASGEMIPLEIVWAIMDCPSLWACWVLADPEERNELTTKGVFTGSLAVAVDRLPRADERLYIQASRLSREGRKIVGVATLATEAGEIVSRARQLAIAM